MAAEFVEADRATRLKALAVVVILALLLLLERLTAPDPAARVTDPALAFKQMTDRLLLVTCVAAPFFLAWSVYFIRLAVKIKRSGQWPPPGVRMPSRTRIRRGRRATGMWIAMVIMAAISVVVFLAVLFAWYLTYHLVADAAFTSTHRNFPLTEQYALATKVQQIPPAVMADLSARMKHDPRLANPGERFNRTDVVDPRYPMRRLVLVGLGARSWFVSYEHGGRGYHRHLVVYAQRDGRPALAYAGTFASDAATLEELRRLVDNKQITEGTEF
jgi:uncharacterized membrane protein